MKTLFSFQINPDHDRKAWEQVAASSLYLPDRAEAIQFAQRLAKVCRAEIRLTEGADPFCCSGTYIRRPIG